MGRKIIVAGAGHGGLVAAHYLAAAGYDVTVYEKKAEGTLGYDQYDSVHLDGFELAGIPVPEEYRVKRTPLSFLLPGLDLPPITQGVSEDSYNVEIDRRALCTILLGLAKEAGARIEYNTKVRGPVMLGSRVAGVETDRGVVYADLVIDAAGLYSPVRSQLSDYLLIDKEAGESNVLSAYRGYFDRIEGIDAPELRYQVYLLPGSDCGLMWVITHEDHADVLIGKFRPLEEAEIEQGLKTLRELNPHLGNNLLRGGKVMKIPVRQPMGMLVADGYAAVGDSAFMTIPIKGSGIGYSMRAGKLLADCVQADKNGCYTRDTLWKYQCDFFENIGFDAGTLAIIKNALPKVSREDIEYLIRENILSPELLQKFGNEEGMAKIISSMGFGGLRDMTKKIVGHQNLRKLILSSGKAVAKYTMVRQGLKAKYEPKTAEKWVRGYNKFYDSLNSGADDADEKPDEKQEEEA